MEEQTIFEQILDMAIDYAPHVIKAILALIIGFWIISRIVKVLRSVLTKRGIDDTIQPFLLSLVSVGLKVLLLLAVAQMFGFQVTSFIAILSAVAFAIGMALQGSLGHFASGVLLLIFKPFKVGDLVEVGGEMGVVDQIQIFNTVLRTPSNHKIIVPNGLVTSGVIKNINGDGEMGIDLTFGIGYDDDIDKARLIIEKVMANCNLILDEPTPIVQVSELADSSVNFIVRPWAKSENYWDVFFYMQENVKKEFDRAGIGIPFPQMDVHVVSTN